jgi:hypothetical protein
LKTVPICLFSVLSVLAQPSRAQSGTPSVPEANPGRPTVSTPATLTPVGYPQFENGTLFAEDSTEFSKRIGVGQVTKLSVLPRSCSCRVNRSQSVSQKTRLPCMKERSSQVCKLCFLSVMNHGQLFRSAMFGVFTQVWLRNSTLALFDNQPRFF